MRERIDDVGPHVSLVGGALALSCKGERLTRPAAAEHVNGFDRRPVDGGDVAVVGDAGEPCGEHPGGGGVGLDVPGDLGVEDRADREIEGADPREQRPDPHATSPNASDVCCGRLTARSTFACHRTANRRQLLHVLWVHPGSGGSNLAP